MLLFKLTSQTRLKFACSALTITRVQEVGDRKCRLQFDAASGGGSVEVEGGTFDEVMYRYHAAVIEESAVYAAAAKAKDTLEHISMTIQASLRKEIEGIVLRKLDGTIIGEMVEKHLDALSAAEEASVGNAFGKTPEKETLSDVGKKDRKGK